MNNKKLLIIILCVSIFILSIGLATFSSNLSIKSSATVSPNPDNFKVIASASETDQNSNNIIPLNSKTSNSDDSIKLTQSGSTAIINNSLEKTEISNISITFDSPGQAVNYDFYIHNTGKYRVYLRESRSTKNCVPGEETDKKLADSTCNSILHNSFYQNETKTNWVYLTQFAKNVYIEPNETKAIRFSFYYQYSAENNSRVDGPLNIEWTNMGLLFSSKNFE